MSRLVLTTGEAGQELGGLEPLDVDRLIARRYLPATRLANGDWGITPAQLQKFVEDGAVRDMKAPDFNDRNIHRSWEAFINAVIAAASEQVTTNEALAEALQKKMDGQPARKVTQGYDETILPGVPKMTMHAVQQTGFFNRKIAMTPKVRQVITSPPPAPLFNFPGDRTREQLVETFGNWGTIAIVHILRREVQRLWESGPIDVFAHPLAKLYHSPEDYEAIVAKVMQAARGLTMVPVRRNAGGWQSPTVWFTLTVGEVIDALPGTEDRHARLIRLAF